jgi:Ca-activated chloride channel family protein
MKKLPTFFIPLWLMLAFALGLTACNKTDSTTGTPPQTGTSFRILAGSELKDVAELVSAFGRTQNVNVIFEYTGTLDAVDRLADKTNFDAVWVSHGKYLQLVPAVKSQIKASEKTMYSRVVLGVKPDVAKSLGWVSGKTGWSDVVAAAKAKKFRFAMTNPTGSNTGFVALAGLAAELSGKGDALEEKDIPVEKLKEFFSGQSMTAGSSGTLADMFVANRNRVDGIINYESVIRSMSAKGVPLEVIIPKEGVITADYPLMLLAASQKSAFYNQLVSYLRSPETQKQIADTTFRTPLAGSGSTEVVNELPFPGSITVVDAILKGFLDRYSLPVSSFFVLDVSGSMRGERLDNMKQAMLTLSTADASSAGRFSLFRAREQIEITPFSTQSHGSTSYELTENAETNLQLLADLSTNINQLQVEGGTAIFSTIAEVYPKAQKILAQGKRTVSIVLLTDGANTNGIGLEAFKRFVDEQGEPKVPVFAILYGDAKQTEMQELAASTGGRVFDARAVKLTRIMKDIRTFQ